MVLKAKTALLQVRIDPELLALFQHHCEQREVVASDFVRKFIRHQVGIWEKQASGAVSGSGEGVGTASSLKEATKYLKTLGKGGR